MGLTFSKNTQQKIDKLLTQYPTTQATCLPVLFLAQEEFGYISKEAMEAVAEALNISNAHVYGVATFYTMYNKEPVGKYHIQVCQNLTCCIMNGEKIQEHLKNRLSLNYGETTPDGKFTLSAVECLASCGTAPMMQINKTYYENLTPEKVDEILESLK